MKARKNLEAVFLAASVMATFAAYATAEVPAAFRAQPAVVSARPVDETVDTTVEPSAGIGTPTGTPATPSTMSAAAATVLA